MNERFAAQRRALRPRSRWPCCRWRVALFALLRPAGDPEYTDAQRGDAKSAHLRGVPDCPHRCGDEHQRRATWALTSPGHVAVAANARVALFDGGQYLLARLDPRRLPTLADKIRTFANQLMDIGAAATAGVPNTDPAQAGRRRGRRGRQHRHQRAVPVTLRRSARYRPRTLPTAWRPPAQAAAATGPRCPRAAPGR